MGCSQFAFALTSLNKKFLDSCHNSGIISDCVYPYPYLGLVSVLQAVRNYDFTTQILEVEKRYCFLDLEKKSIVEEVEQIEFRIYGAKELEALLKYSGFETIARFGDFQYNSFGNTSPKLVLVCQKG